MGISFFILFFIPFSLYVFTLCPTIYVRDAGLTVAGAASMGVIYPPGFPIYYQIGRLFSLLPVGDIPFRVNLMSAFFGALTIFVMGKGVETFLEITERVDYEVLMKKERNLSRRWIAGISSLFLAIVHCFWTQALIAEEYSLNAFLFSLLYLSGMKTLKYQNREFIYITAFILGLSLSNHPQAIYFIPSFILLLFINNQINREFFGRCLISFLFIGIGLFSYIYIFVRSLSSPPVQWMPIDNWDAVLKYFTARQYHEQMFSSTLLGYIYKCLMGLNILVEEITIPGIIMALLGIFLVLRKKPKIAIFLIMVILMDLLISTRIKFNRHTISVYLIPAVMALTFFCSKSLMDIWNIIKGRKLSSVFPIFIIGLITYMGIYNFKLSNRNGCYINLSLGQDILQLLPKGAYFVPEGDNATFSILYLMVVERERPDVKVLSPYGILFDKFKGNEKGPIFTFSPNNEKKPVRQYGIIYVMGKELSDQKEEYLFDRLRLKKDIERFLPEDEQVRFVASFYPERLGGYLIERGDREKGFFFLEKASQIGGMLSEGVHNNVGIRYWRGGYLRKAEMEFKMAIKINPTYGIPYQNLASMMMDMGLVDDAIEIYEKSRRLIKADADLILNLGSLYMKKGDYKKAFEVFNQGLFISPSDERIHFNLAILFKRTGNNEFAKREFLKAIELRPDFSRARNNLGTILVEEGRLSEAEREFRKAIKDDPFYIHALNNLAALVFSKGDLHEAKRLWERSIVLDPDQPDIKEALKKINEEIEMKRLKRP